MATEPKAAIRLLAVDDDLDSLKVVEAMGAIGGFEVSTSSFPLQCIELMRTTEPEVVLLDVMMPGMTGFELCKLIKGDPYLQLTPVILVTALNSKADLVRGLEAGCDDFMTKPIDRTILMARVRSLAQVRRLTENLDNAEKVLDSLARSVEAKDNTTGDHCDRLKRAGRAFSAHLGLSAAETKAMAQAGVLHDIGKIGIPDAILLKPGKLTEDEWVIMKTHTTIGAELLSPLRTMRRVIPIVKHHHERWDGNGYPDGLAGEDIPLLARAFQILDAFDALTSERPYKRAFTAEKAFEILAEEAEGGKWDAALLAAFLEMSRAVS